jgi:alginate O-acetyltransferase complex protein AlgI
MQFVELRFFLLFVFVLTIYWTLRENRARKLLLLAASYFFYAAWDVRFLGLIWLSTGMDYAVGRALARMAPSPWRKRLLVASIVVNLSILGLFKYFDFFATSLAASPLHLILPVGISFYTFETISYTVDVYRGTPPAKSLSDFALFLAFFPHLVAGPILRPREFLPQLDEARRFSTVDGRGALVLVLGGFVKKACIGDNLAPLVDRLFASPAEAGVFATWVGVLLWTAQIYCDFSGYSDLAVGCAELLGYKLTANFDRPYLSASMTELWRRWHMSLSRFLRDYLYIPLGGGHGGRIATALNLMITMTLGGLWHGAALRFVVWGGMNGLLLVGERELPVRRLPRVVGVLLTFFLWCVGMTVFRARTLGDAAILLRSLVGFPAGSRAGSSLALGVFALLALTHLLPAARRDAETWRRLPDWAFASLYGVAAAIALTFVPLGYRPFIYFQF